MHVLHIFNEINFSGAEIMYANAAPLFQDDGYKMTAVSTGVKLGNFTDQFKQANIGIIHKPLKLRARNPVSLLRYFREMYNLIKKENVDVIHVHRNDIFWYCAVCAFFAGKKTIITPHNVFKNRKVTWLKAYFERLTARRLFRATFQTIGQSVYENELNYYKNPSVRINNWYDSKRFFPAKGNEKELIRQQLGILPNDFVIVSSGSCTEIKNHSAIIQALHMVLKNFECTYLHLGSGHMETAEINEAVSLGVDKKVKFLGNKVNVRDYLICADLFIMPSKFEGLSIAAIEAMACGLPGILYNSPGLVDLVHNDDNGFLIPHSPEMIAEKIILLRNDPALLRKKGESALKFVNKHFYMPVSVSHIKELYQAQTTEK